MTNSIRPKAPVRVLVRDPDTPTRWSFAVLNEWRWVDESVGTWEGLVSIDAAQPSWIDGSRMKRIGQPNSS